MDSTDVYKLYYDLGQHLQYNDPAILKLFLTCYEQKNDVAIEVMKHGRMKVFEERMEALTKIQEALQAIHLTERDQEFLLEK